VRFKSNTPLDFVVGMKKKAIRRWTLSFSSKNQYSAGIDNLIPNTISLRTAVDAKDGRT
jgi:hypothetical protein